MEDLLKDKTQLISYLCALGVPVLGFIDGEITYRGLARSIIDDLTDGEARRFSRLLIEKFAIVQSDLVTAHEDLAFERGRVKALQVELEKTLDRL